MVLARYSLFQYLEPLGMNLGRGPGKMECMHASGVESA